MNLVKLNVLVLCGLHEKQAHKFKVAVTVPSFIFLPLSYYGHIMSNIGLNKPNLLFCPPLCL